MQQDYKPTGWLGILLSDRIFVDFSNPSKYPFDECMRKLHMQMSLLLKTPLSYTPKPVDNSQRPVEPVPPPPKDIVRKETEQKIGILEGFLKDQEPSKKPLKPSTPDKTDEPTKANDDEPFKPATKPTKPTRNENTRKPKNKSEYTKILSKEHIKKLIDDFERESKIRERKNSSLEQIDLSEQGLEWVSEDAFDDWNHIRHPPTVNNEVKYIYFDLDLSSNEIQELDKDVFEKLVHLKRLNLSFNKIQQFPGDYVYEDYPLYVFDRQIYLEWLSLKQNFISSLPWFVFGQCTHLRYLSLEDNQIETLPSRLFDGLEKLEVLNLSHNKITKLPWDIFNELKNLTWLGLSHNRIDEVDSRTFYQIKKLKFLDLYENNIKSLPNDLFYFSNETEWLDLNNNPIKSFPANVFDRLIKIKRLGFRVKRELFNTLPPKLQSIITPLEGLRKDPVLVNETCN